MFKLNNVPQPLWLTLLLLMLLSCPVCQKSALAVQLMAVDQAAVSLRRAETLYASGHTQAALSKLRQHILEYSDTPTIASANILISRILLEQQHYADAVTYLQRIDAEQRNNVSNLLLAVALQRSAQRDDGQLMRADHILASLKGKFFSGSDLQLYYLARAASLSHNHEPLQALVVLRKVLSLDLVSDRNVVFEHINSVLLSLSEEELSEAEFMFANTELSDAITLYQATQEWDAGNRATAQQLAERLIKSAHTSTARISAAALLDKVYGQHWQRRAIGVVLPLSGRYAPFGQLVRHGIELAAEHADSETEFIFVDSQADPQQGLQAVRSLVEGYRVMGIVGPLIGDVAQQVVAYVNEREVPVITLSHREGLPEQGPYIFRNCLTTEQQVQALAEYAIEVLGLNNYAILYPDNDNGRDFASRFRAAIEERGGDIDYCLKFGEQDTDFRRQMLLLKNEDPDAPADEGKDPSEPKEKLAESDVDGEGGSVAEEKLPDDLPTVDFEALFVPAYADTIALMAPQLAFYSIENIQLLGINGWNSSKLLQQAGRYTKGAVFSDGFFVDSSDENSAAFVEEYQRRFGEKPSILEAQAYDCALMMQQFVVQPAVDSSVALARRLATMTDFPGVTGVHGFDDRGEAQRDVCLLQFERRRITQIHDQVQQSQPVYGNPPLLDWR